MTETAADETELRCQWCGVVAAARMAHCAACGAALPLTEELGGMVIAGVTDVDPDLAVYRDKPLRIPRGSPTQAMVPGALGAAAAGPAGVLALGALAAVALKELASTSHGSKNVPLDKIGQPSEPVLEMARRLQQAQADGATKPED